MNVGFDLDGVLYDWHSAVYRDCLTRDELKEISFRDFWTHHFNTFSEDKQFNFTLRDPLFSKMIPSKKLLNFLSEVAKQHEIYYITAREDAVSLTTRLYMERYDFPYKDNLTFSKDKATIVKLYRLDIFVDDFPHILESIGKSALTFLVRRPWNLDSQRDYNTISSVFDLKGVLLQ